MGITASAERVRESTEWTINYVFHANETNRPRVLLIGDSICNGYAGFVGDELAATAYVSYYATSKCVTDRSYIKELTYMLEEYDYSVIHFNNGLHSLTTDRMEWETALRAVVKVIQQKAKNAKLIYATATPVADPANTVKAKALNDIALKIMAEHGIPIDDLFGLMNSMAETKPWADGVHFNEEGRKLQAKQVAEFVRKALPAPAAPKAP